MFRRPRGAVTLGHAAVQHMWILISNFGLSYFSPNVVVVQFPWTVPMSHLHLALVFENARFGCALFAGGVNIQLVVGTLLACRNVAPTLCLNRADLLGVWVGSWLVVDALLACVNDW